MGSLSKFGDADIMAMTIFDDGSGPALYAGGWFDTAGGVPARGIARWNGAAWSAVGNFGDEDGFYGIEALAVFDDGSGPALYAGGFFSSIGGVPANNIAKWNGVSWSALGGGVSGPGKFDPPAVVALTVFDDGSGPALYAGGDFEQAGQAPAAGIAKWNGLAWSPLGSGVEKDNPWTGEVETGAVISLIVFDDGTGPALFAGGSFDRAGGVPAAGIAKWSGTTWSQLGSGVEWSAPWLEERLGGVAKSLVGFDDGTGPALYVGGLFDFAGGVPVRNIARWSGGSWSTVGAGLEGFGGKFDYEAIFALAVFDDGRGASLYAGGAFARSGELALNNIARWDGTAWSGLGAGIEGEVESLVVFDDGSGSALYVGGWIDAAGGIEVSSIARWSCNFDELCPGTGDCCEANGTPGCEDSACCTLVCSIDPSCCDSEWDASCGAIALDKCKVCKVPPPPCPWDLNGDRVVNGADLALLLQNWGSPFGGADLAGLLQAWGACPD
jgi:hypothetical protein